MIHDPTDWKGFEVWARERGYDLTPALASQPNRAYFAGNTEHAWCGWAGRVRPTARVVIADARPAPVKPDGGSMTAIREAAARASARCPHGYTGDWSDDCPDCRH
jgi:hypothetical protein